MCCFVIVVDPMRKFGSACVDCYRRRFRVCVSISWILGCILDVLFPNRHIKLNISLDVVGDLILSQTFVQYSLKGYDS